MKVLLLPILFSSFLLGGCVSSSDHECHAEDVTCALGTQKECHKPSSGACDTCECHAMDTSPFAPMQNNSVKGGDNGNSKSPRTEKPPQGVKQDSPRPN